VAGRRVLGTPLQGKRFLLATRTPLDPCGVIHQPGWSSAVVHRGGVVQQSPLDRGKVARGLRSVVEEVLEGVLFDPEPGVRYAITQKTVRGGEAVKQSMAVPRAPLGEHILRRPEAGKTGSSR
jgi:hypothetical protein